jgi:hypothetical protein
MKKILVLLVIGLMFSCSDSKQGGHVTERVIDVSVIDGEVLDTFVHEGCEYLVYSANSGYGGYTFGMHKGNCKNTIHECR